MKKNTKYYYWNDIPNIIPKNISDLSSKDVDILLKQWNDEIWTTSTQNSQQKLANIKDLPPIIATVPEWVMDRLKEAANHYVNGEWLSAIAVTAAISEFLSYYFLENYISENGIDNLIRYSKKLGNQHGRLELLKTLKVLSKSKYRLLDRVREIRNDYLHLNKIDFSGSKIKSESLESVTALIKFLNKHEKKRDALSKLVLAGKDIY